MRTIRYFVLSFLVLGLVFSSGTSSSQNLWSEETVLGYSTWERWGWDTFSASDMIWSQLRNPEGLYVAEIKALVFDTGSGRVTDAVLTTIERLGAGEVFVPFNTIRKTGDSIFVYYAPEDVYRFYGEAPYWSEGFYQYSGRSLPEGSYRTSELIGSHVKGSGGRELGWIDDLVVDSRNGHVVYLILSGVGGDDSKSAAVPPTGLRKTGEGFFTLNVDHETLFQAPPFSSSRMSDPGYAEDLYRHYGLTPYWK